MARMYVIQTGPTIWDEQTRVESAPGAPLTDAGEQDVQDAARELAHLTITTVYASSGLAEQQTAKLVAKTLGAKLRVRKDLRELDYGLWQGLTVDQIKHRQPKLYRQWTESPASIRPPGGETLEEAAQRLRKAVRDILKRHKDGEALVVLRPVAQAVVSCLVCREGLDGLWRHRDEACGWQQLDADTESLNGS